MKNFIRISVIILVSLTCLVLDLGAQVSVDSSIVKKEYLSIEEALKQPDKVYRINLSNQKFKMPSDSVWALFQNLEYLNLGNDHIKNIPKGFGNLKKLKVLDLSGNDFKLLPESLSELENLEEIFLNDEKYMDLENSLLIIKNLPKLRILVSDENMQFLLFVKVVQHEF
jgi:Leucine-rich repeat (LRR) protein